MSLPHSTEIKPFFLRIRLNVFAFTSRRDLDENTFVSHLAQNTIEFIMAFVTSFVVNKSWHLSRSCKIAR